MLADYVYDSVKKKLTILKKAIEIFEYKKPKCEKEKRKASVSDLMKAKACHRQVYHEKRKKDSAKWLTRFFYYNTDKSQHKRKENDCVIITVGLI